SRTHFPRWLSLAGLAVALFAATAAAQAPTPAASTARMKTDIFFLAGEKCEGRGIDTQGINLAADYIAAEFRKAGLKPAGPGGSWFQPFTMNASPVETGRTKLSFAGPGNKAVIPEPGT